MAEKKLHLSLGKEAIRNLTSAQSGVRALDAMATPEARKVRGGTGILCASGGGTLAYLEEKCLEHLFRCDEPILPPNPPPRPPIPNTNDKAYCKWYRVHVITT